MRTIVANDEDLEIEILIEDGGAVIQSVYDPSNPGGCDAAALWAEKKLRAAGWKVKHRQRNTTDHDPVDPLFTGKQKQEQKQKQTAPRMPGGGAGGL